MQRKLFAGPKIRALRTARHWRLERCAQALGVSVSYLSQIETNQRPVTARLLLALTDVFGVSASSLDADDDQRLVSDLREALSDANLGGDQVPISELRQAAVHAPGLVRSFLEVHRAYRRLDERLKVADQAVGLDESAAASSLLPYEEVRDFFHFKDNYIHSLDTAAESLAETIAANGVGETGLAAFLRDRLGVRVSHDAAGDVLRRYDPLTRRLTLNPAQGPQSRGFQMAYQIASLLLAEPIEKELALAGLRSEEARDVCRVGLGNYAAGALLMPYRRFADDAEAVRHDVERLAQRFDVSLEQVCHRLSTLQRPGDRGLPFYFVRTDYAGNITKRHSATRFSFARFGGSCPLWNIHEATSAPDRFLVQLAEMPDGVRYICVARSVVKRSGSYSVPDRRYVLGLGCEVDHADRLIYADGVDRSGPAAPIGVSCRICERNHCSQRAFPPVDRRLTVMPNEREVVPFRL